MNTSLLKNGLFALAIATTFSSNATVENIKNTDIINTHYICNSDIITIGITKMTSDSDFKEIIKTLKKHDIKAKFENIKRNKKGEIISIKINLKDEKGNNSTTALNSNNPINDITLGTKDGHLFITSKNSNSFSFNGTHAITKEFDFDYDENKNSITINGKKFNFDEIGDKLKAAFNIEEDENGKRMVIKLNNFDFTFDESDSNLIKKHQNQKFHFVDDPSIEKHIVINGKKSNFKTLDALAKENKLQTVDFLKSDTAISIYGKKAKDGAIIAITK